MRACQQEFLFNLLSNSENAVIHFSNSDRKRIGRIIAYDTYTIILLEEKSNKQILIQKQSISEIEPVNEVVLITPKEETHDNSVADD
jgi:sRNA-binding regulator protein Hfq